MGQGQERHEVDETQQPQDEEAGEPVGVWRSHASPTRSSGDRLERSTDAPDRHPAASDYPHFDATFPGATAELREVIAPLPEESQRRILGENARRLYRI